MRAFGGRHLKSREARQRTVREWCRPNVAAASILLLLCGILAFAATANAAAPGSSLRALLAPPPLYRATLSVTGSGGEDKFGTSVAVYGDTALVGARSYPSATDTGAAYVFVRSGGVWTKQQRLTAPDGVAGDWFGASVALYGNTAVVGAPNHAVAGKAAAGAAYVFVRSGNVWTLQQTLTYAVPTAGDNFGESVAVYGNTALVGAPEMDWFAGTDAGAAIIYVRSSGIWYLQQSLVGHDAAGGDWFGNSVALDGDTAVAGAPYHAIPGTLSSGAAYVFVRLAGVWTRQQPELNAGDPAVQDDFGIAVDVSDDTVLVGASRHDPAGITNAGAAYVFVRSADTWAQQAQLTATDKAAQDIFGISVALYGNTALVGAEAHDTAAGVDAGAVYTFARSGTAWSQKHRLTAGVSGDYFGSSVAQYSGTSLVGAPFASGGTAKGRAYVFQPKPTITKLTPTSAKRGAIVTIAGVGFGSKRSTSYVTFGTHKCASYVSWSDKIVRCRVPATAVLGVLKVRVTLKAGTSNAKSFTVTH